MSTLTDQEITALQKSFDFYLNANYAVNAAVSVQMPPVGLGRHEVATYDDFIRTVPFEAYSRDPLSGVKPSRPDTNEPIVAYAPGVDSDGEVALGADWYWQNSAIPTSNMAVEVDVDAAYETFYFHRLGSSVGVDQMQDKLIKQRSGDSAGPDPVPR